MNQLVSLTTIRIASARAAGTVHGPGRVRAARTSAATATAITPTVIRCSAERSTSRSARYGHLFGKLTHLVEAFGDQREAPLQAAVEGGAGEVQPLHDHLMTANLLDVVVEQQAAGLGVTRLRRRGELADHVDQRRAQVRRGRLPVGDAGQAPERAAAKRLRRAEVVERRADELRAHRARGVARPPHLLTDLDRRGNG